MESSNWVSGVNHYILKEVASHFDDSYQMRKHMILQERITATQNQQSHALNGFYNLSPWALIRAVLALCTYLLRKIIGRKILAQSTYIHTIKISGIMWRVL